VTRELEGDFNGISDDLRLVGRLLEASASEAEEARELGALLAVVQQYRLIEVFGPLGARQLSAQDPLSTPTLSEAPFAEAMTEAASKALSGPPGEIEMSATLAADPSGWLRVFATALPPSPDGQPRGAIAILIDTRELFEKLRVLTLDR